MFVVEDILLSYGRMSGPTHKSKKNYWFTFNFFIFFSYIRALLCINFILGIQMDGSLIKPRHRHYTLEREDVLDEYATNVKNRQHRPKQRIATQEGEFSNLKQVKLNKKVIRFPNRKSTCLSSKKIPRLIAVTEFYMRKLLDVRGNPSLALWTRLKFWKRMLTPNPNTKTYNHRIFII